MRRSLKITLQVTPEERSNLECRAARERVTLSDYARRVLFAQEYGLASGEEVLVAEVARLRALMVALFRAGTEEGVDAKVIAKIESANRAIRRTDLVAATMLAGGQ